MKIHFPKHTLILIIAFAGATTQAFAGAGYVTTDDQSQSTITHQVGEFVDAEGEFQLLKATGLVEWEAADLEAARVALKGALTLGENAFGHDDLRLREVLLALGELNLVTEDIAKAEAYLLRSLEITESLKIDSEDFVLPEELILLAALPVKSPVGKVGADSSDRLQAYKTAYLNLSQRTKVNSTQLLSTTLSEQAPLNSSIAPLHASSHLMKKKSLERAKAIINLISVEPDISNAWRTYLDNPFLHHRELDFSHLEKTNGFHSFSFYKHAIALKEGSDYGVIYEGDENLTNWSLINSEIIEANDLGKISKALSLANDALVFAKNVFGETNPNSLISNYTVAFLSEKSGAIDEAALVLERLANTIEVAYGKDHPKSITVLEHLADFYKRHEDYKESANLFGYSLGIKSKYLGSEHPETVITKLQLASVLAAAGGNAQSRKLLSEAHQQVIAVFGKDHPFGFYVDSLSNAFASKL